MRSLVIALILIHASSAMATPISVGFSAEITNTTNLQTGNPFNYSNWDTWSDVNSSDIVLGASLTGSIWLDLALAPADNPSPGEAFSHRSADPVIDTGPRWLSLSLDLNGNTFVPATMGRPAGVRTPNSDLNQSSDANQWYVGTNSLVPALLSPTTALFDDWDTEFDGVLHDRQYSMRLNCLLTGTLLLTGADLSSCLGAKQFDIAAAGTVFLRAGNGLAADDSTDVSGFDFTLTSIGSFAPADPLPPPTQLPPMGVPLPGTLWLLIIGVFGLLQSSRGIALRLINGCPST